MIEALKTILDYPRSIDFPSCWAEAELRLAAAGVDFTPETICEMRMLSKISPMTVRFFENLFIAFVKSAAFAKNFIPAVLDWIFTPMNLDPAYTVEEIDKFEDIFMSKYTRPGTWNDIFPDDHKSSDTRKLAVKTLVMNRSIEVSPKTCLEYVSNHDVLTKTEPFFCQLLAKKFLEIGKPAVADAILKAVRDSAKNEMFLK